MQDPVQAAVREVPIHVYDFNTEDPPEGLARGFYYSIPILDEKATTEEIPLAGPYPTRNTAIDGARDFIRDCLTNQTTGEED
jgi:hypothetical protein